MPNHCHRCDDIGLLKPEFIPDNLTTTCWCEAGWRLFKVWFEEGIKNGKIMPETPMRRCDGSAYPFKYETATGPIWKVWQPHRCPHHVGRYKSRESAQRAADKINDELLIPLEARL